MNIRHRALGPAASPASAALGTALKDKDAEVRMASLADEERPVGPAGFGYVAGWVHGGLGEESELIPWPRLNRVSGGDRHYCINRLGRQTTPPVSRLSRRSRRADGGWWLGPAGAG